MSDQKKRHSVQTIAQVAMMVAIFTGIVIIVFGWFLAALSI